jgi:hypothetical protein
MWGSQVPLGHTFSVRDPVWGWGTGRNLNTYTGDGSAIPTIIAGLFFDGIALLLLYILVVIVRGASESSRRDHRMPVPAGADPGRVRRTQHPDRGHHGNAGRRSTHRGRGRR